MTHPTCPRCATGVHAADNFCRCCGWSLQLDTADGNGVVHQVEVLRRAAAPAIRSSLVPLAPNARRAVAVVAAATAADWVIRNGSRRLVTRALTQLLSNAPARLSPRRNGHGSAGETVTIEQRITVRRS